MPGPGHVGILSPPRRSGAALATSSARMPSGSCLSLPRRSGSESSRRAQKVEEGRANDCDIAASLVNCGIGHAVSGLDTFFFFLLPGSHRMRLSLLYGAGCEGEYRGRDKGGETEAWRTTANIRTPRCGWRHGEAESFSSLGGDTSFLAKYLLTWID